MLREVKKNYKIINITILIICIYFVFFPIIAKLLENISPTLTKCPYLIFKGKPCPLCGGTRYFRNITKVFSDINYIFNFFGIIAIVLVLEIVFRVSNICRKTYSEKLVKFDIFLHIFLFLIYTFYEIWFIIYT